MTNLYLHTSSCSFNQIIFFLLSFLGFFFISCYVTTIWLH